MGKATLQEALQKLRHKLLTHVQNREKYISIIKTVYYNNNSKSTRPTLTLRHFNLSFKGLHHIPQQSFKTSYLYGGRKAYPKLFMTDLSEVKFTLISCWTRTCVPSQTNTLYTCTTILAWVRQTLDDVGFTLIANKPNRTVTGEAVQLVLACATIETGL